MYYNYYFWHGFSKLYCDFRIKARKEFVEVIKYVSPVFHNK